MKADRQPERSEGPAPIRRARTTRRAASSLAIAAALLVLPNAGASAQITRDPSGVNVNATGASTVFVTYGNLRGRVPVEAMWCGELVPAFPDIGERCDPATVYGRMPIRYDQARPSGFDGLSDVMTIPASVARRAYQAAQSGADSRFYYVRRFVDPAGGPDEFVEVTCRMTGGGARVPFALTDVRLGFEVDELVLALSAGEVPPPLSARILYNGTGRLVGRWEIVRPGDEVPSAFDLLSEAALPLELRGTQRRYGELSRFDLFLPPVGEAVVPGPDPASLPTDRPGMYMVVLRIEASADREGDSNLLAAGTGTGILFSGGIAGFALPPLRYYVSGHPNSTPGWQLLGPPDGQLFAPAEPVLFSWSVLPAAVVYRLELRSGADETVHTALLQPGAAYRAPTWLAERVGDEPFRWRVAALAVGGREIGVTPWRHARYGAP